MWSATGVWGRAAISIATLVILSRLLLPEDYGVFALAFLVLRGASLIVGGSLAEAIVQERHRDARLETSTFWLMAISSVVLWGLIALGAGAVSTAFSAPALAVMLPVLGVYCPLVAASAVPVAMLMRKMDYAAINVAEMIAAAAGSAAGIAAAFAGAGAWSLAIMECVNALVRSGLCWRASRFRPDGPLAPRLWWDVLRRNWGSLGARSLQYLSIQIPRAAIGAILGQNALGYFVFASRFFERIAGLLLAPIGSVALRAVARVQHDREALHDLLGQGFRFTSLLVAPAFLGMAAIAPDLVPLVFGERWTPAVLPAQTLLLIGVRAALGAFTISILRGVGQHAGPVSLMAVEVALMAALLPLAAQWGLTAACVALLLVQLLMAPFAARGVSRATGFTVRQQLRASGPGLVAAAAMALTVGLLAVALTPTVPVVFRLAICITTGACLYAALVLVLAPGSVRSLLEHLRQSRDHDDVKQGEDH